MGTSVGVAPDLEGLPPVVEHVVHDAGPADPGQVVAPDHPLVVLGDDLARLGELLRGRDATELGVHHPVVEADHRRVRLGHSEVLVVARVGDDRASASSRSCCPLRAAGRSRSCREDGLPGLEVQAVGRVELRRFGVLRARPVERVQVEARRPRLEQLRRRDVRPQHDVGLVEGQVVVEELPEVGEAGRDLRLAAPGLGHRLADLLAVGLAELAARTARAHPREAERRHRRGRQGRRGDRGDRRAVGRAAVAASDRLAQQSLADYEVALGAMRDHGAHALTPLGCRARMRCKCTVYASPLRAKRSKRGAAAAGTRARIRTPSAVSSRSSSPARSCSSESVPPSR